MDDIHIFKLSNGEFCIGKVVTANADEILIRDMRSLIAHPQGVQIDPFMFGNPVELWIQSIHVIASTDQVEKGLLDFYNQQVTGLIVTNGWAA